MNEKIIIEKIPSDGMCEGCCFLQEDGKCVLHWEFEKEPFGCSSNGDSYIFKIVEIIKEGVAE